MYISQDRMLELWRNEYKNCELEEFIAAVLANKETRASRYAIVSAMLRSEFKSLNPIARGGLKARAIDLLKQLNVY